VTDQPMELFIPQDFAPGQHWPWLAAARTLQSAGWTLQARSATRRTPPGLKRHSPSLYRRAQLSSDLHASAR